MEKKVAGTILLYSETKRPRFLVHHKQTDEFVIADVDDEKTNLGSILERLESGHINIEQLDLIDLVMVSYKNGAIPLYVFGANEESQPLQLEDSLIWSESSRLRTLFNQLDLRDTPFFENE